ncbi:MAG: MFS transporter [Deltaproteobacteria bacterium]|nr:MFS transporter [Deltaproteobacteria bacterium]
MLAAARRLPPEVWALGFVSLLTDAASDMIYPLLPALLASVGGGALALGLVEGTAELLAAFVKVWTGRRVDREGGHGRFVIAGYAIATVARPCLALITAPWQAVVARSIDRFGKGIRSAPRDAIISRVTPPERRGIAFGLHRAMDNAGAVVGPLIAALLLGAFHLPVRTVIALAIVPGIFSTALAIWAVRRFRDAAPTGTGDRGRAPLPPQARTTLVAVAFYALGASADSFLLLRLAKLGMPLPLLPIAWLTLQAGKSLLNVPGGALADRFGARHVLLVSWSVYALSYAAFAFAPTWPIFWALFAVYAVHYGLGEGAEKSLLARLVPEGSRGAAFGLQIAVHGVALLPANVLFGLLYEKHVVLAFGLSAALAMVALIVLAIGTREREATL